MIAAVAIPHGTEMIAPKTVAGMAFPMTDDQPDQVLSPHWSVPKAQSQNMNDMVRPIAAPAGITKLPGLECKKDGPTFEPIQIPVRVTTPTITQ